MCLPASTSRLGDGSPSMPQGFRRESRPFGERCELRPTNLGTHPASHAAVGPANDILVPDNSRPMDEPASNEPGLLHDIGGMADHPRHQDRAGRVLHLLPDAHLVLVPYIRSLE